MPVSTRSTQLQQTLRDFYDKPVARVSLELIFTVSTIILLALFAIRPTLLTVSDLIAEIDQKEALNDELALKVAALGSAQNEYSVLESRLPVLDEALPSIPRFNQVVQLIEVVATQNNVTLTQLAIQELPKEVEVQPAEFGQASRQSRPVIVTITGQYANIRQFIEQLRQVRRTLIIDSITFKNLEKEGKFELNATMVVSAPFFGPAIATPSAAVDGEAGADEATQ
jgi:Tfp pilus assembly protein PilO